MRASSNESRSDIYDSNCKTQILLN